MTFDGTNQIERRHGALVKFTCNILLGIAHCIEWSMKFILYFALHFVDVLEAVTGVISQIFKVTKLAIKVMFTFGILLRFVGQSLGAEGSFLLLLSSLTYLCFWTDSSLVTKISDILHVNVCIICICIWLVVVPVEGLLVFVRLKRKIRKQIDLLVNYDNLYEISEYADKSTETANDSQPSVEGQDYCGQWASGKRPFSRIKDASGLNQRKYSSSEDETDKSKDTGGSWSVGRDEAESEKTRKSMPIRSLKRKKKTSKTRKRS